MPVEVFVCGKYGEMQHWRGSRLHLATRFLARNEVFRIVIVIGHIHVAIYLLPFVRTIERDPIYLKLSF